MGAEPPVRQPAASHTHFAIILYTQLLMQVLRVKSDSKKAFSTIATLVRIHLISHLEVFWMITNSQRTYSKQKKRNKSPCLQTALF